MCLDFNKLDKEQRRLVKEDVEEKLTSIPKPLIHFSKNKVIGYCLAKKVGMKDNPSPRVLNNWIRQGLVGVKEEDKGRIKRFDKLETIWLNILIELREYGLSVDSLLYTREVLFKDVVNGFFAFKFYVLNTILNEPQTLLVYKDGEPRLLPTAFHNDMNAKRPKHALSPSRISLELEHFIAMEYPNHYLDTKIEIENPLESVEKLKLLYFLKTGDFISMRIEISKGDIRYIDKTDLILSNKDIYTSIVHWNFIGIIVSIDKDTDTIIKPN